MCVCVCVWVCVLCAFGGKREKKREKPGENVHLCVCQFLIHSNKYIHVSKRVREQSVER